MRIGFERRMWFRLSSIKQTRRLLHLLENMGVEVDRSIEWIEKYWTKKETSVLVSINVNENVHPSAVEADAFTHRGGIQTIMYEDGPKLPVFHMDEWYWDEKNT